MVSKISSVIVVQYFYHSAYLHSKWQSIVMPDNILAYSSEVNQVQAQGAVLIAGAYLTGSACLTLVSDVRPCVPVRVHSNLHFIRDE